MQSRQSRQSRTMTQLSQNERTLSVTWADGYQSEFHYIWLRDNCLSPESRYPNGQRILETISIPPHIQPQQVQLTESGDLEIIWANDQHQSRFPAGWLRAYSYPTQKKSSQPQPKLWDVRLMESLPEADYQTVRQNKIALKEWLSTVRDYGFALLHQVTVGVTEVAELFGYIRQTSTGRFFDIKAVAKPSDLAYTDMALSPHTDNPFRDPVPTLQLLICVASDVEGGDTILVDGFNVAEKFREQHPQQFKLLASLPVRFQFTDEDTVLTAEVPLISLNGRGEITAIHFNNRSVAPFDFETRLMEPYYEAYRTFALMLNNPEHQIRFRLKPGDLVAFDNRRILHGRTAYSGPGSRHLQGCYADRDGLYSYLNILERDLA